MVRRISALAVLLPALALAACEGASGWSGTVTDSAGVTVVENPATGAWGDDGAPALERTLDVGNAMGDPNEQFGQIMAIDVDASGNIYVLDAQARHVKMFDADGNFVRQIGGPGNGPGELGAALNALMVGPGDTLLVPDLTQQRIVRYAPDGQPGGDVPLPLQAGIALRWEKLPDGRLLQQSRFMDVEAMQAGEDVTPSGDPLIVRDQSGAIVDTLMTLPAGQSFQMSRGQMRMRLFDAEPVWSVMSDGGVAYAMNSQYSVNVYSPSGDLDRIVRLPSERRPVTEQDQQAMLEVLESAMRRQIAQMGVPASASAQVEQQVQQFLGMVEFAEFYPAFANLVGGPDGSLWVQQGRAVTEIQMNATMSAPEMGAPRWDVFDADGRYLGVVEFPERFAPMRFVGNRIYGLERDEMDVPHLVRLELPAGWQTAG